MLSKDNQTMDSAHKRRYKKDKSRQSYKHSLEKQKLQVKQEEEAIPEPQPSSSQDPASANEDETKLSKKASATVLKKALNKKGKRVKMSSKEHKTRDDEVAAKEAKKIATQKGKSKEPGLTQEVVKSIVKERKKSTSESSKDDKPGKGRKKSQSEATEQKSNDEVDKAAAIPIDVKETMAVEVKAGPAGKDKDQIQADRAQKKAAKQAMKKGKAVGDVPASSEGSDMTVKDVVVALKDIKLVAIGVKDITAEVKALDLRGKKVSDVKQPEPEKSKAELKAERRAKQDAQRAAKQAATAPAKPLEPAKGKEAPKTTKLVADAKTTAKAMSPKPKTPKKMLQQNQLQASLFGQQYKDNALSLKNMPVNSHIHPAFIKLGVQLSTREVRGANARCIALFDALKKMTKDYTLPANTEFSRGLDAHLTETVEFLATMRQRTASEINAIKFYRHHLMQLPNNVNEFEAKKTLEDEIDRYIREQIEVAGEAISADVRKKISPGDVILTYGHSSTVERCLVDAHLAGIPFSCVVCGSRGAGSEQGTRELTRRLTTCGLPLDLVDITALSAVMRNVNLVLLGAVSILNDGSVLGAVGTAQVALMARDCNVPVLIACETHKFSERVQTDAFAHNELRNPDDLNAGNEDWPLKKWRSLPLEVLNLAYDITPPSLVTAVVTELAILPCTSVPVVLRFRATAYGI